MRIVKEVSFVFFSTCTLDVRIRHLCKRTIDGEERFVNGCHYLPQNTSIFSPAPICIEITDAFMIAWEFFILNLFLKKNYISYLSQIDFLFILIHRKNVIYRRHW